MSLTAHVGRPHYVTQIPKESIIVLSCLSCYVRPLMTIKNKHTITADEGVSRGDGDRLGFSYELPRRTCEYTNKCECNNALQGSTIPRST